MALALPGWDLPWAEVTPGALSGGIAHPLAQDELITPHRSRSWGNMRELGKVRMGMMLIPCLSRAQPWLWEGLGVSLISSQSVGMLLGRATGHTHCPTAPALGVRKHHRAINPPAQHVNKSVFLHP